MAYNNEKERIVSEIMSVLSRERDIRESIMICSHTPHILQELGLADYPILFSQRHVRNCLHEKGKNPHWHGLSVDFLSDLPSYLDNPAFVYDSLSHDDSIVVALAAVDNDTLPIIASIRLDGNGQYHFQKLNSNYLTSVYGHENLEGVLVRVIDNDMLLYVNKENTHELGNLSQLQLLRGLPKLGYDGIIHKSVNLVNLNEEEQEMEEIREKIYIRIPKSFVRKDVQSQKEGQEGKTYNKVTLPQNARIADKSIGGFSFYPMYVNEDKFSDKLYNIPLLADQKIQLNKDGEKIIATPAEIRDAVKQSYKEYANEAVQEVRDAAAEYDFAWEGKSFQQYCQDLISNELEELEGEKVKASELGTEIIKNSSASMKPLIILVGEEQCTKFIGTHMKEAKELYAQVDGWMENPFTEPEKFTGEMIRAGVTNILSASEYLMENKDKEITLDAKTADLIRKDIGLRPTKSVSKSISKKASKDIEIE